MLGKINAIRDGSVVNGKITVKGLPGRVRWGAAVTIASFVGFGTVTALWDNRLLVSHIPVGVSEIALLAMLSLSLGVYVGIRRSFYSIVTAVAGGVLGFLGLLCPVCDVGLLPLPGGELLLSYIEPIRVYIAAAGIFIVLVAVIQECVMGDTRQPKSSPGLPEPLQRYQRALSDYLLTFYRYLASPHTIGMVVPSSAGLTKAMAGTAATSSSGTVVEFGSGTGSITTALLESGIAPENLVLVERDVAFHKHLVARFPGIRIILGDVTDTKAVEQAIGNSEVTAIVSALPILIMSRREVRSLLRTVCTLLSPNAVFVQYTYGRGSPFPEDLLREFGLEGERQNRVWLNVPPATVWRFRRRPAEVAAVDRPSQTDTAPCAAVARASAE